MHWEVFSSGWMINFSSCNNLFYRLTDRAWDFLGSSRVHNFFSWHQYARTILFSNSPGPPLLQMLNGPPPLIINYEKLATVWVHNVKMRTTLQIVENRTCGKNWNFEMLLLSAQQTYTHHYNFFSRYANIKEWMREWLNEWMNGMNKRKRRNLQMQK